MKKGQKQEETAETDTKTSTENNDSFANVKEEDDDENEEDWFKVKEKPDALEQINIDLPEPSDKDKKITKAKLAKKLRKKNLLINKRIKYDDDGNVSYSRHYYFICF